MNNRIAGLLLIGFSLLTAVIAYGFDQLSNAIKESAGFIKSDNATIGSSSPSIPLFSIILIILVIGVGVYLMNSKDKQQ
ncbi:hypothetical protein [Ammoniphilus sp. 3BR4]|uniref:hypothetical protein n=1 Tax=Ammoniphilus sp. 3BR4 TaxID=3158265 RepID=UPI003466FD01